MDQYFSAASTEPLEGEVEIDGAYFGGHVCQENQKEDRKNRRTNEHRSDRRQVVIAFREHQSRTLSFVRMSEAEDVATVRSRVTAKTVVFADEASHWDALEAHFKGERINHSEAYSFGDGKHTNWVESYFSCLRRMIGEQHHFVIGLMRHQGERQGSGSCH